MSLIDQILLNTYVLAILFLSGYTLYVGVLICICPRRKREKQNPVSPAPPLSEKRVSEEKSVNNKEHSLPKITVQVPVFNERYIVSRIINAVANLDYPRDKLQIQILDDSTDDTTEIARVAVDNFRAKGINIKLIHRSHRTGFKAGALAYGMEKADGEFIAIFDADFVPHSNFIKRLICDHRAFEEPDVGFAQTRWVYLNRERNFLTRAYALMLDVHFFIDHPARQKANLPFNFNGSGGIWRRTSLEDAGGWEHDTLTEDLDLSYRAKMKGWRGVYYLEEEAPNDLPTDIAAFKQQQRRWARGTIQCFRKLIWKILRSNLSLAQKISSVFHMGAHFLNPSLLVFIGILPILLLKDGLFFKLPIWVHLLSPLFLIFFAALYISNKKYGGNPKMFFRDLPFAIFLAIGISVSNTFAVTLGLFRKQIGVFERTPKELSVEISPDNKNQSTVLNRKSGYRLKPDWTMWGEIAMACYIFTMAIALLEDGLLAWAILPLFYALLFGGMGLLQFRDMIRPRGFPADSIKVRNELLGREIKAASEAEIRSPAE